MRRADGLVAAAAPLVLAAVVLVGCTSPTTAPGPATASPGQGSPSASADGHGVDTLPAGPTAGATPGAPPGPTASPTQRPAATTLRLDGPAGPATLTIDAPADAQVTTAPAASGSTRVTVRGLAEGAVVVVRATRPDGAALAAQPDGTVTLASAAGTVLGGIAPPTGGDVRVEQGRALVTAADNSSTHASGDGAASGVGIPSNAGAASGTTTASGTVTLWVGAGTPRSATWGTHDGGRSLAVDPNAWARAAGLAGGAATWSALTAAHPDADTPGMHDQLVCHAVGAPTKATWNLEPWRPDVGLVATLAARCNP